MRYCRYVPVIAVATVAMLAIDAGQAHAQVQRSGRARITGVVTDAQRAPVENANVTVRGTSYGVSTDAQGRFTIINVPEGLYTIDVRRLGFGQSVRDNVTLRADSTYTFNFQLNSNPTQLEQVVVSGSGEETQTLKIPYTVAKLTAEDLPVMPNMSAAGAIQGKVAGAQIIRGRGPGAGVFVQLRTPTSQFGSNSPLYIVDGVILNSQIGSTTVDIDNMNIAEIEVLKGSAATALYGSRASGGVVSIRTNRGRDAAFGETTITASTEMGQNNYGRLYGQTRSHYFEVNDQGQYVDRAGNVVPRGERVTAANLIQDNAYIDPLYDQASQLLRAGGFMSNSINITQNSAATNFVALYSRYKEQGIVDNNNGFERQNFQLNLDHRIGNLFNIQNTFVHVRQNVDPNEVSFTQFFNFWPDVDLTAKDANGQPVVLPDANSSTPNPLYRQVYSDQTERRNRTQLSSILRASPLSWLSFEGNVSYDRADEYNDSFINRGRLMLDGETPSLGSYTVYTGRNQSINMGVGARANRAFGDLTVTYAPQVVQERETRDTVSTTGTDFTVGGVKTVDAARVRTSGSTFTDRRANRFINSLIFDYAGKYNVEALWSRDGSSLFGPENRWNDFGRLSASYRISEESWFPWIDAIPSLRAYASYGRGGTRPGFSDQYETATLIAGGGVTRQVLGNRELRPEITNELEFGVDAVYKDRVTAQLVYYNRTNEGNVIAVPVPAVLGFNTQERNVGSTNGRGVEATVNVQLIQNPGRDGFNWSIDLNADRSESRITAFNRSCYTDGSLWRCEGTGLTELWGNRLLTSLDQLPANLQPFADQFQVNDEGFVVAVGPGNRWTEGMAKNLWGTQVRIENGAYSWGHPLLQRDQTGVVENLKIGDFNPDARFGLRNNLRWKGFNFYTLLTGQVGGHIYNDARQYLVANLRGDEIDMRGRADSLKKSYPYFSNSTGVSANYNRYLENFVEDGDYIKLAETQLRYSVPEAFLARFGGGGVKGMQLALNGRNLYSWSKYSGLDPEVGTPNRRIDRFGYPFYRTYTANVTLRF